VISNVALLGRPLLVKIIFFFLLGVGLCLFIMFCDNMGLYFEKTGVAFHHALGFYYT